MKILLSNDDGIYSAGLWSAAQALKELGEVFVVAPDREQSGVGTSVSLHHPIRVMEVEPKIEGVKTFAVEGTPADSVILGLEQLVGGDVDLVVAGINQGSNLGEDVLVSGTVGAALQGYVRGKPSIAISVTALKDLHYEVAALLLKGVAREIGNSSSQKQGLLFNINIPNLPIQDIQGVLVTSLGHRSWTETVKEGEDGRRKWYWISRDRAVQEIAEGTDIWALRNKMVSITPLQTNLTSHQIKEQFQFLGPELFKSLRPS